MTGKTQLEVI